MSMPRFSTLALAALAAAAFVLQPLSPTAANADPVYPFTSSCPNLTEGMSGSCVAGLQYELDEYYGFSLAQDGQFGPATEAAVVAFQQKAGIGVDGQAGPQTRTALYNDSQDPATNCQPILKLEPNFSNGGLNDFGAKLEVILQDPSDFSGTCTGVLERDTDNEGWVPVSDIHTVPSNVGEATSDFYWDGIGAVARACATSYSQTVCTAPF